MNDRFSGITPNVCVFLFVISDLSERQSRHELTSYKGFSFTVFSLFHRSRSHSCSRFDVLFRCVALVSYDLFRTPISSSFLILFLPGWLVFFSSFGWLFCVLSVSVAVNVCSHSVVPNAILFCRLYVLLATKCGIFLAQA